MIHFGYYLKDQDVERIATLVGTVTLHSVTHVSRERFLKGILSHGNSENNGNKPESLVIQCKLYMRYARSILV